MTILSFVRKACFALETKTLRINSDKPEPEKISFRDWRVYDGKYPLKTQSRTSASQKEREAADCTEFLNEKCFDNKIPLGSRAYCCFPRTRVECVDAREIYFVQSGSHRHIFRAKDRMACFAGRMPELAKIFAALEKHNRSAECWKSRRGRGIRPPNGNRRKCCITRPLLTSTIESSAAFGDVLQNCAGGFLESPQHSGRARFLRLGADAGGDCRVQFGERLFVLFARRHRSIGQNPAASRTNLIVRPVASSLMVAGRRHPFSPYIRFFAAVIFSAKRKNSSRPTAPRG